MFPCLKVYQPGPLNVSARQTKTGAHQKSVGLDETAHHEPSHQDLYCLPFCSDFFYLSFLHVATMDMSEFNDGNVHFINLGRKGCVSEV